MRKFKVIIASIALSMSFASFSESYLECKKAYTPAGETQSNWKVCLARCVDVCKALNKYSNWNPESPLSAVSASSFAEKVRQLDELKTNGWCKGCVQHKDNTEKIKEIELEEIPKDLPK